METFIISVVAGLFVAALVFVVGYLLRGERYRRKLKAAPNLYAERLGALIQRAYKDGVGDAVVNARAIVSVRNDMLGSLVSIAQNLNSEISAMQDILDGDRTPREPDFFSRSTPSPKANPEALYHYIHVLHKTWPEKRIIIETQIHKLIIEMGLESA